MTAPRSGPEARAHSIGGPAWRRSPARKPGTTSSARATATRRGRAASIRPTAVCVGLLDAHAASARSRMARSHIRRISALPG